MARMKLQKLGLSCAAAYVGGVGGASFTRKMSGVTALEIMASTRICAPARQSVDSSYHQSGRTESRAVPTSGDMSWPSAEPIGFAELMYMSKRGTDRGT